MSAFTGMHVEPNQFAEYVDELREFSGTYKVPYGKPENLGELLEKLHASPSFAADFGSMMRSIDLRERFQPLESEFLLLVAVAWGGVSADEFSDQLPALIHGLREILPIALKRPLGGHATAAENAEEAEEAPDESAETDEIIREMAKMEPSLHLDAAALNHQEPADETRPAKQSFDSGEHTPSLQHAPFHVSNGDRSDGKKIIYPDDFAFSRAAERFKASQGDEAEDEIGLESRDPEPPLFGVITETKPSRRLEPSAAEIVATTLTGLVIALLLNVYSLPVYRSRVSVYLPSSVAAEARPSTLRPSSIEGSLRDGELIGDVAQRLLLQPHTNPILREDALSRGMRDIHLGGMDPILYADLVGETSHSVNVRRLDSQNLYEITCDSWSPQFASTFCNALITALQEQPSGPTESSADTQSARAVDEATGPGIQIYPHWYLISAAGLAVGCLVGILLGFVQRSKPERTEEEAESTE